MVLLGAFMVSGCALPVPVQVASWALDGISYLATDKSVTDHGISFIAQKDCALWRGVQGREICDSYEETGAVTVAALAAPDGAAASSETVETPQGIENIEEISEIATLETASGEAQEPQAPIAAADVGIEPTASEPVAADAGKLAVVEAKPAVAEDQPLAVEPIAQPLAAEPIEQPLAVEPIAQPTHSEPVIVASLAPEKTEKAAVAPVAPGGDRILIPGRRSWSEKPGANMYYVIGSFQNRNNAKRLVSKHKDLGPSVMASRVNGKETYRVAIGPFTRVEQRSVDWTIRKSGIRDSWAISIDRSRWQIAGPTGPKKAPLAAKKPPIAETASLPDDLNQNIDKFTKTIDNKQTNGEFTLGDDPPLGIGTEAGRNILYGVAGRQPGLSGEQIGRIVNLA